MNLLEADRNEMKLQGYYRWHANLYDLTRWAFLFGRSRLIDEVAFRVNNPVRILEVGCGTGKNLVTLARTFPGARITGLDLSRDMLERARSKVGCFGNRIELIERSYEEPVARDGDQFDLIIISYALSMINPGFEQVITLCREDLRPGGLVAVVDFHETRWSSFRRWMRVNHVRMEGQILKQLGNQFESLLSEIGHGYGDLWRYLLFIGR